jgi:hypothetical protein
LREDKHCPRRDTKRHEGAGKNDIGKLKVGEIKGVAIGYPVGRICFVSFVEPGGIATGANSR